jgi:hypothetical protein
MFGYAKKRAAGTYRMYTAEKNSVVESRDVTWHDWTRPDPKRDLSFFIQEPTTLTERAGIDDQEMITTMPVDYLDTPTIIPTEEDDNIPAESAAGRKEADTPDSKDDQENEHIAEKKASRLEREMRKLDASWNPDAPKTMGSATVIEADEDKNKEVKEVNFILNVELHGDDDTPSDYNEAMHSTEKEQWAKSMGSEILNFVKRKSWKPVKREEAKSSGRTIMKTKWVFKKKDKQDGTVRLKSCCVSKGFQQRPGVDYTESFSPVASDTAVRAVIVLSLYMKEWTIEIIDIEAAFLEGTLEEPAYIEWPEGMVELGFITEEQARTTVAQLFKSMYGNVNAALQLFKEYVKHMCSKEMGMYHPCVFVKKHEGKLVLLALTHVDDTQLCGEKKWIEWFKENIKKRSNYTDLGKLTKDKNGETIIIATMPKMVKEIITAYEKYTGEDVKSYTTPSTPGVTLEKNAEEEPLQIDKYCTIVGKIMYLVTKIFGEGANQVRELTRHFANPGKEHWKALDRFVGYLKANEKNIKLTYRKPRELRPVYIVDSNYTTDKTDRHSVSGKIHTLGGIIVGWLSKTQNYVTLSVTEAEYVSASTGGQDILFLTMLLQECGIKV